MLLECGALRDWDAEREFAELFEFKRDYKEHSAARGLPALPPRLGARARRFDEVIRTECVGNRSLLFHSSNPLGWHAVDAIECPEDEMRRVFIVVVNTTALYWRVRDWMIGKKPQRY
jgi:hypothetical protein